MKTDAAIPNIDMNTRDLFERSVIPFVCKQMQASRFDEAIATIDNFYRLNGNKDCQGRLKYKSDAWKALILEEQGKYAEALVLYKSTYQSLQQNDDLYVHKRLSIIKLLHKLEKDREAIAEIDTILKLELDISVFELLALFNCYVDCLESSNKIFPQKYLKLVARIAKEFAPKFDLNYLETHNINLAIKQMVQRNRGANRAYSLLLIQLDEVEREEQIYLLRNYLSTAKIDFYRQMAIAQLKQIES